MNTRFIVISGLIGVGKTTFSKQLAEKLNYKLMLEPVDSNPYLGRFYKDPVRWAYPMQEFLKSRRFAMYQFAVWGIRTGEFDGVVMDRSIHEDTVFAEINMDLGNIHKLNWDTYLRGFQDMQQFCPEPDLYLFLDATPDICKARSDQRGRGEEVSTSLGDDTDNGIPLEYMQRLHIGYMDWIADISDRVRVARLDWTEFLPVNVAWELAMAQVKSRSRFTRSLVNQDCAQL